MKEEIKTLILYRLERAKESIDEALILLEKGYTNTTVNRLYYACFYAVSALLFTKGISSSKHSGVRGFFHQYFVKPGTIDVKSGHLYDRLFDTRQKGDYADLIRFDIAEVQPWVDEVQKFVIKIEELIKKEDF
ncbi:HEPN domain-containing protein [bacterium]|nr:HEPN domain-containing protein [bacterium]MBU1752727.1 HEPN domain-containing protein [bacterium]